MRWIKGLCTACSLVPFGADNTTQCYPIQTGLAVCMPHRIQLSVTFLVKHPVTKLREATRLWVGT